MKGENKICLGRKKKISAQKGFSFCSDSKCDVLTKMPRSIGKFRGIAIMADVYAEECVAIGGYADGHTGHGHAAAQRLAPKFFVRLVPKASIDE